MTDDRSLERAARSWIEVGPTAAPPHVVDAALALIDDIPQERDWFPWRFPRMSPTARVAALVAVGALILAGAFALVGGGGHGGPVSTNTPASSAARTSASPVASAALALSKTFVSPAYGYTVGHPDLWAEKPATRLWGEGEQNLWDSGYNDELTHTDIRFSGASYALPDGETSDQWLSAYAAGADRSAWPSIKIGGQDGYLTADGAAAAGGTIAPGGLMFDAVVVSAGRAYNFNMDGRVDRPTFDAFLASITLDPTDPTALPLLDGHFQSPWYGYAINVASAWSAKAATAHWHGVDNSPPAVDEISIPGTDTTISVASQPLAGKTLDAWLVPFHANTTANVPLGCDGGAPSTWPTTTIAGKPGRWYELCNAAEAIVQVGDRVYAFTWGNSTFDTTQHFAMAAWLKVLESMTISPKDAVDR